MSYCPLVTYLISNDRILIITRYATERETSDELVEFVVEVISVANELLVDKLKALCSAVLRRFGM